jgi:hypothetical protein
MRNYRLEFYVEDARGVSTLLGSIVTGDDVFHEGVRKKLGWGIGLRGWNRVVCGQVMVGGDWAEGPGYGKDEVLEFHKDDKAKTMSMLLVDGVKEKEAPHVLGYTWVIPESAIEEELAEGVVVAGVALDVWSREELEVMKKDELLRLCEVYDLEAGKKVKAELVDMLVGQEKLEGGV